MGIEEYLTEIKNQIRDKKAREFASDELKAHIEDRAEGLQKKGMDHDSAVLQAVKEMGDPVSVGVDLDRIHRPRLEWKFLLYVIYISILSVGVLGVLFAAMPRESVIGNQFAEGLLLKHTIGVLFGLVMMIIVYRLDYTILAGKSRLIAAVLVISLAVLVFIFGVSINGGKKYIRILGIAFQTHALYLLYLPMFAGILYDYRNKGAGALFKIFLWMIAPAFLQSLYDAGWMPFVIFMLFSESILFMIALNKNWYRVNKRKVFIGMGIGFIAVITYFDCNRSFSADRDYASFFQSRYHQYHNRLHPPRPCPVNLQIPGHPRGKRACNYIIGIIRKIFDINPGDNLIVP